MDTKSEVLSPEAEASVGERQVYHLLTCDGSSADVGQVLGSRETRKGIELSWKSGEGINKDSSKKTLAFPSRLKGQGSEISMIFATQFSFPESPGSS